jgi:hypothetical protein
LDQLRHIVEFRFIEILSGFAPARRLCCPGDAGFKSLQFAGEILRVLRLNAVL